MQNVPKIVKERLKSAAIAADHPDANLLAAFSERTLAGRERSQILEHLTQCAECREVVALALPATEPGLAVVRSSGSSWLSWPQLGWGLVAAGVIVAASFGFLRYEHSTNLNLVASRSQQTNGLTAETRNQVSLPTGSEEAPTDKSLSTPAAKSPDVAEKSQIIEAKKESDAIKSLAGTQASRDDKGATGDRVAILRGQQLSHGPMPPTQWQQNLNANTANQKMMFQPQAPAPTLHAPAANEQSAAGVMVSAQSSPPLAPPAAGPVTPEKQVQEFDTLAQQERSIAPLSSSRGSSGAEVARAKDAEPPVTNVPKAKAAGAYDVSETSTSKFSPAGALVPESAHWAINSAGGLQRSFDQGKNWQTVDVNSSARESSGVNLLAMKSSPAKAPANKKTEATQKPIIFRAVAANGPDVWAGGSESTLFHSTDSGDHWLRIQPSWRGLPLSGDILSLQFADPQHGRIVTSTAEIWTTADAGQTWDKQ